MADPLVSFNLVESIIEYDAVATPDAQTLNADEIIIEITIGDTDDYSESAPYAGQDFEGTDILDVNGKPDENIMKLHVPLGKTTGELANGPRPAQTHLTPDGRDGGWASWTTNQQIDGDDASLEAVYTDHVSGTFLRQAIDSFRLPSKLPPPGGQHWG